MKTTLMLGMFGYICLGRISLVRLEVTNVATDNRLPECKHSFELIMLCCSVYVQVCTLYVQVYGFYQSFFLGKPENMT